VSLLSGRNFDTRTFETRIAEDAFVTLEAGLRDFMNEDNFKRFLMIVRSAGFIDASFIRSQAALNFSYALYLALRDQKQEAGLIERWVRRWFVMSLITSRYTGSPESAFDEDIRNLKSLGPELLLKNAEAMLMTDSFWEVTIAQGLEPSATTSPLWGVFLAAQVKLKDKGFLSRDISIEDLVTHMGDIHHIFPKDFLKKHGLTKGKYNQIANYVYMQSEINIKIGNKAPKAYFELLRKQCEGGPLKLGSIDNLEDLRHNLTMNCIPESIMDMDFEDYERFLEERRGLMAKYMKHYYTKSSNHARRRTYALSQLRARRQVNGVPQAGLAPFAERETFSRMRPNEAKQAIAEFAAVDRMLAGKAMAEWDVAALLNFMWTMWNDIFIAPWAMRA
jgi:hypothetical protein